MQQNGKSKYLFTLENYLPMSLYKLTSQCDTTLSYAGIHCTSFGHKGTRVFKFQLHCKICNKGSCVYSCLECIQKHLSVHVLPFQTNVILNTKQTFKKHY